MVEEDAQERVEVRQEIDWVLGEVGEAVVFVGVDVGRVEIGRRRAVERDAQARDRRIRTGGEIEAFQQAAVGIAGIADHDEVHVIAGHTLGGEFGHGQPGEIRALRPAEDHHRVGGVHSPSGDLALDRGVQNLFLLRERGVDGQGVHAGDRIQPLGREGRLDGAVEATRLQVQLFDGLLVTRDWRPASRWCRRSMPCHPRAANPHCRHWSDVSVRGVAGVGRRRGLRRRRPRG